MLAVSILLPEFLPSFFTIILDGEVLERSEIDEAALVTVNHPVEDRAIPEVDRFHKGVRNGVQSLP